MKIPYVVDNGKYNIAARCFIINGHDANVFLGLTMAFRIFPYSVYTTSTRIKIPSDTYSMFSMKFYFTKKLFRTFLVK